MDGGANRRWGRHQRPIIAGGGHAVGNKAEVSRQGEGEREEGGEESPLIRPTNETSSSVSNLSLKLEKRILWKRGWSEIM